jgi:hypothetical protein
LQREISDEEGITWTCVQAFAGLGEDAEKAEAARVEGSSDRYHVVCTPSGGAKSIRLRLPGDWDESFTDEQLLDAIRAQATQDE